MAQAKEIESKRNNCIHVLVLSTLLNILNYTKMSKSGFSCLTTSKRSLSAPISKLSEVVNGPVAAIIVKPKMTESVRGRHGY